MAVAGSGNVRRDFDEIHTDRQASCRRRRWDGWLASARALADYFEQVVVLERDTLPLDASHRTGTPQARHTHGLLSGGKRALT